MDLWNQHPRAFWCQYWKDRKAGIIDKSTDPIKDHGADPNFGMGKEGFRNYQKNKFEAERAEKKAKKKKKDKDKKKKEKKDKHR